MPIKPALKSRAKPYSPPLTHSSTCNLPRLSNTRWRRLREAIQPGVTVTRIGVRSRALCGSCLLAWSRSRESRQQQRDASIRILALARHLCISREACIANDRQDCMGRWLRPEPLLYRSPLCRNQERSSDCAIRIVSRRPVTRVSCPDAARPRTTRTSRLPVGHLDRELALVFPYHQLRRHQCGERRLHERADVVSRDRGPAVESSASDSPSR
jgi:hypothetical protein